MRYNIPLRNILRYNDLPYNHCGKTNLHIVQVGETLYSIAQQYGIRLKALYKKNKLQDDREPLVGQIIVIRGKRYIPPESEEGLNISQLPHNEIPEPQGAFQPKSKFQPVYPLVEMEIAPKFDQPSRTYQASKRSVMLPVFRKKAETDTALPMPNRRHENNRYGIDSQQIDDSIIWAGK